MRRPNRRIRLPHRSTASTAVPAPALVSIELSRPERDALHPELSFGLAGVAPDLDDREQALGYRRRLDLLLTLHDDLGWAADDPRDRFTVIADAEALRRWLTDLRATVVRAVRDEHGALRDALDDAGGGSGRAAVVRQATAVIDGDLETIHACDAILARLPAPEAPPESRRPHRRGGRGALAGRAAER